MRNWTDETLTATRTSSGHFIAWRQASWITQAPIGTISPVSSASGMNSSGATRPRVGMVPADQRLERADPVGLEIEQRLVIELELAVGDRAPQIRFEPVARLRAGVHLGFEEAVGAAALALRLVEREVGMLEQGVGVGAVARRHRDADAGADRELVAADLERLGERGDQPAGDRARRLVGVAMRRG